MLNVEMVNANGRQTIYKLAKYATRDSLLCSKQISGKYSIGYGCVLALVQYFGG